MLRQTWITEKAVEMKNITFTAPWSASLALMTGFCVIFCLAISIMGIISIPSSLVFAQMVTISVPLLILFGGALFAVRGYTLQEHTLLIKRLLWSSRLNLSTLISATHDPEALDGSMRAFGNGGLFSFSGLYRSSKLGFFRVYGTDPKRAVILRFPNKTVVITPDLPEQFIAEVTATAS